MIVPPVSELCAHQRLERLRSLRLRIAFTSDAHSLSLLDVQPHDLKQPLAIRLPLPAKHTDTARVLLRLADQQPCRAGMDSVIIVYSIRKFCHYCHSSVFCLRVQRIRSMMHVCPACARIPL